MPAFRASCNGHAAQAASHGADDGRGAAALFGPTMTDPASPIATFPAALGQSIGHDPTSRPGRAAIVLFPGAWPLGLCPRKVLVPLTYLRRRSMRRPDWGQGAAAGAPRRPRR